MDGWNRWIGIIDAVYKRRACPANMAMSRAWSYGHRLARPKAEYIS